VDALLEGDLERLDKVIADDAHVNALEVAIDDDCQHIIARRQPAASDLRMVITVIKTITDLERIGDEAQKIARMGKTIYQAERYQMPRFREVKKMADVAIGMLRRALDSFARLDPKAAFELAEQDQQLDYDFASELRQLITFMMEDPRTITMSIDTLFISKAIERIGDHAKNISEYVVYLVKGKDIRHTTLDQKKRETLGLDE
jgi:phosphate transport system protein